MAIDFETFTLVAATADLGDEPAARGTADAVEFRMDMASDPLSALADYDGDLPLVATNRPAWEGGERPEGPDRLAELERAVDHESVGAVDVELAAVRGNGPSETAPEENGPSETAPGENGPSEISATEAAAVVDRARETDTAVVVSTHDFQRTPDRTTLRELLDAASEYGDVAKLAVTADGTADTLSLLSATRAATADGHTVATMAMGAAGRHTRAVAPLYGSKIGYAPVDPAEATAPGQYDLETLADLVERLRSG
jgi:3-dehydroquinate dehydratase-1